MTPRRIQLRRSQGWRKPANTIVVSRPSKWGNRWTTRQYFNAGYSGDEATAAKHCVDAYRAWLRGERHWAHSPPLPPPPDLTPLRGRNLACWCKPGAPCHADVLLELANSEAP